VKTVVAIAFVLGLLPCAGRAGTLNLTTLSCGKYENEVLPAAATNPTADSINTVMWLFGYSVAKSGAHVLYPDALAPFGFALDNECKSNPAENLLDALNIVKPEAKSPMDLSAVECSSFASRHAEFARSDPESATTIMMWLFGFSVAASGSHLFDADSVGAFETSLLAYCGQHPSLSLLDTLKTLQSLKAPKAAKPAPHS
jgi:HdeA/HdeB family